MKSEKIALIGAGSLGQQIAQHIMQQHPGAVVGFFDDTLVSGAMTPYGPILGPINSAIIAYNNGAFDALLMGIGYNHLAKRQSLFQELAAAGIPFTNFVHSDAVIDSSAQLGLGCVILSGCIIDLNVEVGPNVFMYSGCVVAHDSKLVGHSFLAPGCRIAGHVTIAERCFLGIGTVVSDELVLKSDIRTGAGAVVVHHLSKSGTYVGVPAHLIRSPS